MEDSDEAERRPIQSGDEASEEATWMAREWTSIAAVSIGFTLLLVLGLWAATAFAGGQSGRTTSYAIAFVAVLVVAAFAFWWGRDEG